MPQRAGLYAALTFYFTALWVFFLDQWSKVSIEAMLRLGETKALLPGLFHLTYVRNFGAAFSLFHGQVGLLTITAGVIALAIVLYQLVQRPQEPLMVLGLGLLLGGALGNFVDRATLGFVRDMLDLRYQGQNIWPIFNVADMAVLAGIGLLLLHSLLENPRPRTRRR